MNQTLFGDCRESLCELMLRGVKMQTCVTSPPYFGLRDYGHPGQLGLENTVEEYVANLVVVFRLVREVLADDGVLWLNLGDSYFSATKGGGGSNPETSPKQAWKGSDNGQGFGIRRFSAGDTGLKPKDLIGIPWRVALALQADGWYLRQDIIWAKPNPMPESVTDRCTKSHEYLFILTKNERYYFDNNAIKEPIAASTIVRLNQPNLANQVGSTRAPGKTNGNMKAVGPRLGGNKYGEDDTESSRTKSGNEWSVAEDGLRNKRSVWTIAPRSYSGAHFATFPPALIEPCILAGSRPGDTVLDPFMGSGTTAMVAERHGRRWVGCELNEEYGTLQTERLLRKK